MGLVLVLGPHDNRRPTPVGHRAGADADGIVAIADGVLDAEPVVAPGDRLLAVRDLPGVRTGQQVEEDPVTLIRGTPLVTDSPHVPNRLSERPVLDERPQARPVTRLAQHGAHHPAGRLRCPGVRGSGQAPARIGCTPLRELTGQQVKQRPVRRVCRCQVTRREELKQA